MHPLNQLAKRMMLIALVLAPIGGVPARAQERPSNPAPMDSARASAAGGWSSYRPGTAWARSSTATTPAATGTTPTRAVSAGAYVSPRGWTGYAPASAWRPLRPGRPASAGERAGIHTAGAGWATYTPSSAWTGYRPGAAWQGGYSPAAARPLVMRQAHVPGPSPYADGLARNYYEYGTGRPVPLTKPWLPGAP